LYSLSKDGDEEVAEQVDTTDPLLGATLVETYRIQRVLAEGGMGRLYAGLQLRLQLPVAVKILHQLRRHRAEAIERAEREARAMATIQSPHVVRVMDLVRTPDGRPCLVTELLEGEDLGTRLEREGKLAPHEAIRIARQMCLGLTAAHRHKIVHRDLKPSNVFLTERDEVKVLDFGVAKLDGTEALTHSGAFLGTPAYMAPEQAEAASNVDERADVYAVGAILYHMLAGIPPYGTVDATQTLMRLLKEDAPRLIGIDPTVSTELAGIVEAAMTRNPQERLPSTQVLHDELARHAGASAARDPTGTIRVGGSAVAAKWQRPGAVAMVTFAALFTAAWCASLAHHIVFDFVRPAALPSWGPTVASLATAAVALFALALMLRPLFRAWRSGPRVQRLGHALGRALLIGLATLATGELALMATRFVRLEQAPLWPFEGVTLLGVTLVATLTGFAIACRRAA
jgi:serine/threonine-protein kinase